MNVENSQRRSTVGLLKPRKDTDTQQEIAVSTSRKTLSIVVLPWSFGPSSDIQ